MTSVTISTSVTYNTDNAGGGGNYGNYGGQQQPRDDSQDIGNNGGNNQNGGNNNLEAVLNNMNIPDAIKDMLRKVLGGSSSENLPSEASAVDTMQKFQKDNGIGLISADQMTEIATKGTLNGKPIPGTPEQQAAVQDAAKAYMANNGALFDKVESATDGKHDSQLGAGDPDHLDRSQLSQQPTQSGIGPGTFMQACANNHISPNKPEEYDAVKTMEKFQKDNGIGLISADQMTEIATKGTLNGKEIPGTADQKEEVQDAAKTYMANNGALFDKIESATDGKHDSQLSAGDAEKGVEKGLVGISPKSERGAVDTMEKFQKDNKIGLISADQMTEIATKGTLNGKPIPGTPEQQAAVQDAAKTYMANNGALFDKIESSTDGKHDSQLGAGDPEQARNKGVKLSDQVPGQGQGNNGNFNINPDASLKIDIDLSGNQGGRHQHYSFNVDQQPPAQQPGQQPSAASDTKAVETMEKFQKDNKIGLISADQMTEIATKGTLNGKPIPGTPEQQAAVQDAAKAYMANNGALFDKIESATDGKHDSQLGAGDPEQARKKGEIGMSDSKAVSTMDKFQEQLGKDPLLNLAMGMKGSNMISNDQMREMADKGTLNGHKVPDDVRASAEAYVAQNGALFDKVEAATDGKHDSMLGGGDGQQARDKGLIEA